MSIDVLAVRSLAVFPKSWSSGPQLKRRHLLQHLHGDAYAARLAHPRRHYGAAMSAKHISLAPRFLPFSAAHSLSRVARGFLGDAAAASLCLPLAAHAALLSNCGHDPPGLQSGTKVFSEHRVLFFSVKQVALAAYKYAALHRRSFPSCHRMLTALSPDVTELPSLAFYVGIPHLGRFSPDLLRRTLRPNVHSQS